ncbi:MAG: N-acetylmuramoyl-L-alanine amidase [Deltaproteobacteria bacterium]|nr:N-acetylmuramoyl-L-alanine amidase [Deltaproteobacteria bacterium]
METKFARYGMMAVMMILACMAPLVGEGAQRQNPYLVLIDPAHGGGDPGTVSDKVREKDLTMSIANLVRQEAQKKPGLQIQLTRTSDKAMTIAERVKAVVAAKADCLISLHVNAGFGKKSGGYEIYFPGFQQAASGGGDSSAIIKDMARNKSLNDSVRLAQQFQSSLDNLFPRKGRGLRDAPSPLLEGLSIPGLVIEIGFITNSEDRAKLTEPETQRNVARALVKGLQDDLRKAP